MDLHQINLTYLQEEDRILYRTSFRSPDGELQEIRAWLTRRMVRNLWDGMVRALETQVTLDKPQAAHARSEIVGMEHETSVAQGREQGRFDNPYEAGAQILPLGETPILVTRLTFNLQVGQPVRINLAPTQDSGFEIALSPQALHGFCSVLLDAVRRADWDLELAPPGPSNAAVPPVLN